MAGHSYGPGSMWLDAEPATMARELRRAGIPVTDRTLVNYVNSHGFAPDCVDDVHDVDDAHVCRKCTHDGDHPVWHQHSLMAYTRSFACALHLAGYQKRSASRSRNARLETDVSSPSPAGLFSVPPPTR